MEGRKEIRDFGGWSIGAASGGGKNDNGGDAEENRAKARGQKGKVLEANQKSL